METQGYNEGCSMLIARNLRGLLLMGTQGHNAGGFGTTLLIHQQYYTKTDSPHYNTSSDTYQFFGKSYFGSSKPIALHLSKLE